MATMGPGGDGTASLTSAVTGRSHTFVWDSVADIGYGPPSNVRVRITPFDSAAGSHDVTGDFEVHNPRGDFDGDGDFDLVDFARFQWCFSGSGGGVSPGCDAADFEPDGDVDLDDYHLFESALTGPIP